MNHDQDYRHLMPAQGDRSQNSVLQSNKHSALRDARAPSPNELYIGHIPCDVDGNALRTFFSQYGEIERLFEGKRGPSGGMKWAFISYVYPEDAFK